MQAGSHSAVQIIDGMSPTGDTIFMPCNSSGTPGELNTLVLNALKLTTETIPSRTELEPGYAIVQQGSRTLCFIVTVNGREPSAEALNRGLRAALEDKRVAGAKVIWLPLMATGAGNLSFQESERITLEALADSGWASRPGVEIYLSGPRARIKIEPAYMTPKAPYEGFDPAATDLVRVAASLRLGLKEPPVGISTRLLLCALIWFDDPVAPGTLRADVYATVFNAAVRASVGDKLSVALSRHFKVSFVFELLDSTVPLPSPTPNLQKVLDAARVRASARGATQVTIQDIIVAALETKAGRLGDALKEAGIDPQDLLKDFLDARRGQISLTLHNDVAATRDRLGYQSYATAISAFITHANTPPPISVSIQAPWGVGKSSLMRMIQEHLDPAAERRTSPGDAHLKQIMKFLDKARREEPPLTTMASDRRWTVWFNAWKYETTEQMWTGLVDAIVRQVCARLDPVERELFLLRLQLARVDDGQIRKRIYDRVLTIWWASVRRWVLAWGGLIATLLGLRTAAKATVLPVLSPEVQAYVAKLGLTGVVSAQVILAIYLGVSYFTSRSKTQKEPARFSLADYLQVPDYSKTTGSVHQIHADLEKVLAVIPKVDGKPSPLVIFIDDLDRCAPKSVAAVVEGVSTFLAGELQCVFVIGMDPQMVAAALEDAHSAVRKQLPSSERSVPLGWRFMDKFIQLPFTIPPSNAARFDDFMDDLIKPPEPPVEIARIKGTQISKRGFEFSIGALGRAMKVARETTKSRSETLSITSPSGAATASIVATQTEKVSITSAAFKESRDVGAILNAIRDDVTGNPRELKRLANLARFYLQLRNERQRSDTAWVPPEPESYARWIVLTARWPDMMRWLLWGADEASWGEASIEEALAARRLREMESGTAERDGAQWAAYVVKKLNIPDQAPPAWLNDAKLYEFFVKEARRPSPVRVSTAAARQLW